MYDCLSIAEELMDREMCVTCIPVVNEQLDEDVAVVALEPSLIAYAGLHQDNVERRMRMLIAVAIRAHRLLPSRGLSFRCPSSS